MNLLKLFTVLLLLMLEGGFACAQSEPPAMGSDLAKILGISFPGDSQSAVVLVREGRQYVIDVAAKTVKEIHPQSLGSAGRKRK
jgi:hypothetical protein